MKITIKKPHIGEFLFMLALFIYTMQALLSSSALELTVPKIIFDLLKYSVVLFVVMKWFITEKFTSTKFIAWLFLFSVVFIIAMKSNYTNLIILFALLLSSQDVDFDVIVKNMFKWVLFWTVLIVLLYFVGILPDFTYTHIVNGKINVVHSYGFKYYSGLGYSSMALTIMYLYMKKNMKIWQNVMVLVINYLLYTLHTTRLSWNMIAMFVLLNFLCERTRFLDLNKKIYKVIATILPFGVFLFTLEFVKLYSEGKIILSDSMETIVSRLEYSIQAFEVYGVNLFGTYVKQYGGYAKYYMNTKTGFFIDSGYIYILIAYGLIFSISLMLIYTLLYRYIYETKNKKLYLWLGMILVVSIINNFLLAPVYCPIIFYIPKMIRDVRGKKLKEEQKMLSE